MNLIIKSVTIVDLTNKEAIKVNFSEGKNLLTSEHNHLGKSLIMKSIYYSLGAEVFFATPIKSINLLTYVDFNIGDDNYRACRLGNVFALYKDQSLIKKVNSVGEFGVLLEDIFELNINLVGKDEFSSIIKSPPAFYYLPYYIDQENGWSINSSSFDRMSQFDLPQRKNSYFFHLGVLDNEFVEKSKLQKINDKKATQLKADNEKYLSVIETLSEGLDETQMSFDVQSLELAIKRRQHEINNILSELSKIRKSLVEAEDNYIQIQHERDILSKYIKTKKPQSKYDEKAIEECPRCGMFFESSMTNELEKIYLLESLNDDFTNISKEIGLAEKRITKLKTEFFDRQQTLHQYENSLVSNQDIYNIYVKSKATKEILDDYKKIIGANIIEIEKISKNNLEINKTLTYYNDEKKRVNKIYQSHLNKLFTNLDIPKDQVDYNSEPGTPLVASGAYGPRCKVAQILSFIKTRKDEAPHVISFPLIIDSPNVLEQDKDHLDSVIRTLLTWDKTDNQIIVASIEGKELAKSIDTVNIIALNNPKNHLLSKDSYLLYESEISDIFTIF